MTERRQKATQYLLELLKTYGRRTVVVKVTADGTACVAARTFVTRQLAHFAIPFPFDDISITEKRHENTAIDQDKLSVIFHLAIIEYKEAYIDDVLSKDPNAGSFITRLDNSINNTYELLNMTFEHFEEEELVPFLDGETKSRQPINEEDLAEDVRKARERLADWGHTEILDFNDVNKTFWDFAYRRVTVGRAMKSALLSMTDDLRLQGAIINSVRNYNTYIQPKIETPTNDEKKEKSMKSLTREHNLEMNNLRHELKKECNRKIQKVRDSYSNAKGLKKISKLLFRRLLSPGDKFLLSYNLTKANDVEHFIRWFEWAKKKVPNSFVKYIDKQHEGHPEDLLFFHSYVEVHNAKFIESESTSEQMEDDSQEEELIEI